MQHIRKTNRNLLLLPRNKIKLRSRLHTFYFRNPAFELKTCKYAVCLINLNQKQHALGSNSGVKCSPENQNENVCF